LLAKAVEKLDEVQMDDRDTKGDIYEYMLGKIAGKMVSSARLTEGAGGDSLANRLFVQRVDLLEEIDKRAGEGDALVAVREDTAKRLHDEVAAMSLDNFIAGLGAAPSKSLRSLRRGTL
jgi:hypothetical protein